MFHHLAQGHVLAFGEFLLHQHIGINPVFQVEQCVEMIRVPAMLPLCTGSAGIWIFGIRRGLQGGAVNGQQAVTLELFPAVRESAKR